MSVTACFRSIRGVFVFRNRRFAGESYTFCPSYLLIVVSTCPLCSMPSNMRTMWTARTSTAPYIGISSECHSYMLVNVLLTATHSNTIIGFFTAVVCLLTTILEGKSSVTTKAASIAQ